MASANSTQIVASNKKGARGLLVVCLLVRVVVIVDVTFWEARVFVFSAGSLLFSSMIDVGAESLLETSFRTMFSAFSGTTASDKVGTGDRTFGATAGSATDGGSDVSVDASGELSGVLSLNDAGSGSSSTFARLQ
jgi:hypothetical protein